MMKKNLQFATGILIIIFFTSCNVTKHLKNNETLYTGGSVKINNQGRIPEKKTLRQDLEELLPKKNLTILGARPKLWVYYNVDPGSKTKGLKAWIRRKVGEPPVLIEKINTETVEAKMVNLLNNRGHFQAEVNNTEKGKGKKISLEFVATVQPPYRIKELFYPKPTTKIDSQIIVFKEKTLLRPGDIYNLEKLEDERSRIDTELKELGYFYFSPDFLIFKVDSTIGDKMINVYLEVKPEVPEKGLRTYRMDEIYLNPDYEIADTLRDKTHIEQVDNINFVKKGNGMFRPKSLTRLVFLKEDSLYSRRDHNITLNRMMGLDVFKYVNIRFTEIGEDSLGGGRLAANIQASPLQKKSLRAEVQGYTKSTNFSGPAVQLSFKNRNAFRGAELFIFNINSSFESQFSGQYKNFYAYEFQPQVQLYFPRFLLPFNINTRKSLYVPRTRMEFNYTLQNIVRRYNQNSFNLSFGYQWKETVSREHILNPINITFIKFDTTLADKEFRERLKTERALQVNFQNQVLLGSNYSYTYNNLLESEGRGRNHFYFNGNADVSGNLFNLLDNSLNITNGGYIIRPDTTKERERKGVRYSQYVRGDVDFRVYHDFSKSERLATRLYVGVGYPHGNSEVLPFAKQFFVGGPASLRGFKARTIGPGIFNDTTASSAFFSQLGDMRVEGNIEYRFDLISVVKAAFFVDAGNTWLTRRHSDTLAVGEADESFRTSKAAQIFKFNKLYEELAISAGAGLRIDVSFLVLRLDLAMPIRQFYYHNKQTGKDELVEGTDRWAFDKISFFDPMWRKRNLVLNIAIGYPF